VRTFTDVTTGCLGLTDLVLCVDNGEYRDKQHHQDRRSAVQGEVCESRVDAEAAVRAHHDHD